MPHSPTVPACLQPRPRRLLLVAGFTVPLALVGSMLGASAAVAAPSGVTSKTDLVSAFDTASSGDTVALGGDLTGSGGSADVLTVPDSTGVTLDLAGHELDLDHVILGEDSSLTVENTTGGGSGLVVGGSASGPSAVTGIEVGQGADFEVGIGTKVAATGSEEHAGIGTVAGASGSGEHITIDHGATVHATGGSHAAGIGGGPRAVPAAVDIVGASVTANGGAGGAGIGGGYANPSSTSVQVSGYDDDSAVAGTVVATGGAGAAGIGGGEADPTDGGGIGASVTFSSADVTAADGGPTTDALDGTDAPSAIGGGQGTDASAFGSLASRYGTLRIAAGSTLSVPSGATLDNYGSTIVVDGTLTGTGTVSNQYGSIRAENLGTIDDAHLTVTGSNHLVTLDPGAGTTTAPTTLRVYSETFAGAGIDLSSYSGTSGDTSVVGWSGVPYWGSTYPVSNTTALGYFTSPAYQANGGVAFTAVYGHPISFTGATMPGATLGKKYDQPAPVTGDVSDYWVGDESEHDDLSLNFGGSSSTTTSSDSGASRTISGLPVGMTFNETTGHITGYPAAPGHYSFTVEASTRYQDKSETVTMDVAGAPTIATSDLPDATSGTAYSVPLTATSDGDGGAITYAVSGGALPAGLSLNSSTGLLSGTPSGSGTFTFGLKATNSFGSSRTALTLTVGAAASTSTGTPKPGASTGTPTPGAATSTPASGAPASTPSAASATTPAAPVLPSVDPTTVKIGHRFALSVAASSTEAVTYSVPAAELPKGLTLNAKTGLISGVPQESGHFTIHVSAKSTSGTSVHAYSFAVPGVKKLLTANVSAVTPKAGSSVEVAIHGLKVNERWHITVDGKVAQTGVAKFGGTVHRTVHLPANRRDTKHVIRLSGSRAVSDPAVSDHALITVTSVAPRKHLSAKKTGSVVTVRRLAGKERVMVTLHGKRVAAGRADDEGAFTFSTTGLKSGKHRLVVTGSTAKRTATVTVKVVKAKH